MECLPFVHAVSGCDTTFSLFGHGKLKALKLLQKHDDLRKEVTIFGEDEATYDQIREVGERFVKCLYYASSSHAKNLDELRELF